MDAEVKLAKEQPNQEKLKVPNFEAFYQTSHLHDQAQEGKVIKFS